MAVSPDEICRCKVTEALLDEWGFTVEVRTHVVGAWHIAKPGMAWTKAVAAAIRAGRLSMLCRCTPWAPHKPGPTPTVDPEMLAFFTSITRKVAA